MNVLEIIRKLLGIYNEEAVPGFADFVKRILEAGGANETTQVQVVDWLMTNAGMPEERAKRVAELAVFEIQSGAPGVNKDAGGLA